MKGIRRFSLILVILVTLTVSLALSISLNAQVTGATLKGTVSDISGAAIAGASISIKNVATGVVRTLTADSAGFYSAPNLTAGAYEVTVTSPGFSTLVRSGLTLTVGAQQELNLTMQVGQVTQTVEVTGEAPAVELASSEFTAVVNSTTVVELPLNGRSWTDLAVLQRGVSLVETSEGCSRGCGANLSIAGARPAQNNYRLDGISMNDFSNSAPGSILGGNLGVDAVQEFSVVTNNYSAEYGMTSGGVVNAITRSGANQIHGNANWFLRDEGLDARNFFDPTTGGVGGRGIAPFHRNQFGAALGAPIQKDKTFIFGDYEGIRQSLGVSVVDKVPSMNAHSGILSTGNVTVDPQIQKVLPLFPFPNAGLLNPDQGLFKIANNQSTSENFFTIRVDRKFSEKDSMFATFLYDSAVQLQPDSFENVLNTTPTDRRMVILEESHVFSSTLVNTARIGFNRATFDNPLSTAINSLAADTSLGPAPGLAAPGIKITGGYTSFPGGVGTTDNLHHYDTFQGYDDAFLTRGVHSFKFGAAFERIDYIQLNGSQLTSLYGFGSLSNFLTNNPSTIQATIPGHLSTRRDEQYVIGGYIQDDWRFRPNLTLNLGLRYEMATVMTEAQGKTANLVHYTDATIHTGNPYFMNPTKRNFEPRVGFAWDPFKNGKSSVRGGFGVFDVLPLTYNFSSFMGQSAPFFELGSASNLTQGSYPVIGFNSVAGVPTTFRAVEVEFNPKRNYVMQWNLDLQREITPTLTAMVGYVGSHGVHNPFRFDDMDTVLPTLTSAGWLWPAPISTNPATRLNPNWGDIRGLFWAGESSYDGLLVGLEKRMGHGLQAQGSFTWSKSLDTSSSIVQGDQFANSLASLQFFDIHGLNYGPSDFNIGRTLIVNFLWQVPKWQSAPTAVAWVANGWQLGSIFKLNDGPPFTPTFGTGADPAGTLSSDALAYPDRLTGPGCATLTNPGNPNNYVKTQCFTLPMAPNMAYWQANCDTTSKIFGPKKPFTTEPFPVCFNLRGNSGRNIAGGPGLLNLDFSVYKNNYIRRISENFNAQFRAEFFNILNRANFKPPLTPVDVFDGNGNSLASTVGHLTSTVNTSRQIQFALKLIW